MTLRTCTDCMHWRAPHSQAKNETFGQCSMLVIDPRTKRIVPESDVDRHDLWRADPFRITADFNACRGWAPADRRKAKPELTLIAGGKTA